MKTLLVWHWQLCLTGAGEIATILVFPLLALTESFVHFELLAKALRGEQSAEVLIQGMCNIAPNVV